MTHKISVVAEVEYCVSVTQLIRAFFELAKYIPTNQKQELALAKSIALVTTHIIKDLKDYINPDFGADLLEYVVLKFEDDGTDPTGWVKGYQGILEEQLTETETFLSIERNPNDNFIPIYTPASANDQLPAHQILDAIELAQAIFIFANHANKHAAHLLPYAHRLVFTLAEPLARLNYRHLRRTVRALLIKHKRGEISFTILLEELQKIAINELRSLERECSISSRLRITIPKSSFIKKDSPISVLRRLLQGVPFSMETFCNDFLDYAGMTDDDELLETPFMDELFDLCVRYLDKPQPDKKQIESEITALIAPVLNVTKQ